MDHDQSASERHLSGYLALGNAVREKLNCSMLCREFVRLLSCSFGRMMLFSEEDVSLNDMANQRNVDVWLEPAELEQSLDDLSERILHPCANMLAQNLKVSDAAICFHLDLPPRAKRPDLHCSVQRWGGFSIRCLLSDPKWDFPDLIDDDGLVVPDSRNGKYELRFDVLFSGKRQAEDRAPSKDLMWEAVVAASA